MTEKSPASSEPAEQPEQEEKKPSPSRRPAAARKPETPAATTPQPHWVAPWQPYCPECGAVNPEYAQIPAEKLVFCNTCDGPLGSEDNLSKMKVCPHCGQTKGAHHHGTKPTQ